MLKRLDVEVPGSFRTSKPDGRNQCSRVVLPRLPSSIPAGMLLRECDGGCVLRLFFLWFRLLTFPSPNLAVTAQDGDLVGKLGAAATRLLSHGESRVRLVAGETLGVLASVCGADVYKAHARDAVLSSIRDNLERDVDVAERDRLKARLGVDAGAEDKDIFHESAGWKTLETGCKCVGALTWGKPKCEQAAVRVGSFVFVFLCRVARSPQSNATTAPTPFLVVCRALLEVAKGLGKGFGPMLDAELLDLVFSAIKHTNRFVRETGYYVCGEFVAILTEEHIGDTSVVRIKKELLLNESTEKRERKQR